METDNLKKLVREKYSEIALNNKTLNAASCCGATDVSNEVYNIMTDDYSNLKGYNNEADLGLGCGLPTEFAQINPGDIVLDLGSGAGNDCFIARHETGPTGKVIGIDFTPAMIKQARKNAEKLKFHNVEFREGDIEEMPVSDNSIDVVVSNCVLNLLPEKTKIFKEIYRTLKPNGHFSISDIVIVGELPPSLKEDAEMYAGCVAGAIQKEEYLSLVKEAGFHNITIQKEKTIVIPDDILQKYLDFSELESFKSGATGIFSITVFATKSEETSKTFIEINENSDCKPGSGCC